MRQLLAAINRAFDTDRAFVLCSLVETRGSTPQKAGAAMLVYADGSQAGTLGGGCVEAEVKQRALGVLSTTSIPKPYLLTFHLDDNYGWDDGLICGGRMTILADPRKDDSARVYFRRFHELVEKGEGCTEAIVTQAEAGAQAGGRYLLDADGLEVGRSADAPLPATVRANLIAVGERPRPYVKHGVSYLPFLQRVTLLIVGAGHVGQAVAKLAGEVDFNVWVLDDRAAYANDERFPSASRRIIGDIGAKLAELKNDLTPSIYALIVTRGHAHDEEALFHLANTSAGYVGMIGSKRKIKLIFEDLIARGISAEILAKVHAPLGIAIGSQTVPEIAVSIVAELIAVRNLGSREVRFG